MKRRILVSGGNRGIGLEVCRQLAHCGHDVFLGTRDLERGRAALSRSGFAATVVPLDVAHPAAAVDLSREIGEIDILINNAGIHYDDFQSALNADWRIIREAYEVNLFGAWRLAQAFVPAMVQRRWGRIVNVSSEVGSLASMEAVAPAYASSKAALNALTCVLADELRGTGILVNAICPGWTNTDMGGAGRPVAEGAASVVWGALLPDDGPTGGFFRDGKPLPW